MYFLQICNPRTPIFPNRFLKLYSDPIPVGYIFSNIIGTYSVFIHLLNLFRYLHLCIIVLGTGLGYFSNTIFTYRLLIVFFHGIQVS